MFQLTEEQRKIANETKAKKRAEGLALYKCNWAEDSYWVELAKEASEKLGVKVKLPQHHIAPSGIRLDKFAKLLGVELGENFFGVGCKTTSSAIRKENLARPDGMKYNARMYWGLVLELWKEKQ